jgi:type IV pilus assembly protein PilA
MKPAIKPELQAKFLTFLNNRKNKADEGFTLIELLVVVIIIGVLAAIALPSLLGQVSKAKQSEARQNIGAINRAQQSYFLQPQQFADSLADLGIGIKSQTDNYTYSMTTNTAATNSFSQIRATARKAALKSYFGVTGTAIGDSATSEVLTLAAACESLNPITTVGTATAFNTACAGVAGTTNFTDLGK